MENSSGKALRGIKGAEPQREWRCPVSGPAAAQHLSSVVPVMINHLWPRPEIPGAGVLCTSGSMKHLWPSLEWL